MAGSTDKSAATTPDRQVAEGIVWPRAYHRQAQGTPWPQVHHGHRHAMDTGHNVCTRQTKDRGVAMGIGYTMGTGRVSSKQTIFLRF
jgi:hypothetical protein